jgi:phosphoglycolate phosphatase/putative hydrolase of the HAD superfamily
MKCLPCHDIEAVLFDLDGTLYRQWPVQAATVVLLLAVHLTQPSQLFRKIKIIRAFRLAQETLRAEGRRIKECSAAQAGLAARSAGVPEAEVRNVVQEWMQERPLMFLRWFRPRQLPRLLGKLKARGFRLGLYSDYPAQDKVAALGLDGCFDLFLSSQDAEVHGFKPDSNGFEIAARRMRLRPDQVLYIGDRAEVDAAGAAAAGMPAIILKRGFTRSQVKSFPTIESLGELERLLKAGPETAATVKA